MKHFTGGAWGGELVYISVQSVSLLVEGRASLLLQAMAFSTVIPEKLDLGELHLIDIVEELEPERGSFD